ncbi:serine/threonine protein phosphatase [Alphaproteobacteria bacterium GH1-50]|uniref:Serine/threonine protein phosphatase n=1 Tax=Kangsaoukella pontilimi TaxID=2691042 RepID=A0A7C9MSJ7_9RHOB|nr:metallophosphoesterase family protein [Kangsaoukella pontilimi]MXQ09357.1 serine/threonine protein phosphatase [Kangsaoukella pontilimi]
MRVYAIGDIHGHLSELRRAHDLIEADRRRTGDAYATVVHLGDLVDRGPESRGVIDYLIAGIAEGHDWIVLQGNHDRLLARYVRTGVGTDGRLRDPLTYISPPMGGLTTLASYGVKPRRWESDRAFHARVAKAVPEAHLEFLESLPFTHVEGELLFVHAGIKPGVPLHAQDEDDLVWIRDPFLWDLTEHPWLVVHGHSPVDEATHYGNRVNLDTGAGYGNPTGVAVFEGRAVWALSEDGRRELTPPGA